MGNTTVMAHNLSPELLAQLYGQNSGDPFLTLLTLSHTSFSDIRLVNNTADIVSNGLTFTAYPFKLVLPRDDGDTSREINIDFDNVGLELVDIIRTVTDAIDIKLEMVLASIPNEIQMSFQELKIQSIVYNKHRISAKVFLDSFLNTEISSEKYTPSIYPGLF
jgi:hypothetical protein